VALSDCCVQLREGLTSPQSGPRTRPIHHPARVLRAAVRRDLCREAAICSSDSLRSTAAIVVSSAAQLFLRAYDHRR